jgi:hypothetical protein
MDLTVKASKFVSATKGAKRGNPDEMPANP